MQQEQAGATRYWGKARPSGDGEARHHLLAFHSLDVAATGRTLLQRQPALLDWIAARLQVDAAATLDWLTFWLALHDLGKFATSFQNQRPDLLLTLQQRSSPKAYTGVRHDSLGELIWSTHLLREADVLGLGSMAARYASRLAPWVSAVTGHHGQPPDAGATYRFAHFDACDEAAAAHFIAELRSLMPPDAGLAALTSLTTEHAVAVSPARPMAIISSFGASFRLPTALHATSCSVASSLGRRSASHSSTALPRARQSRRTWPGRSMSARTRPRSRPATACNSTCA